MKYDITTTVILTSNLDLWQWCLSLSRSDQSQFSMKTNPKKLHKLQWHHCFSGSPHTSDQSCGFQRDSASSSKRQMTRVNTAALSLAHMHKVAVFPCIMQLLAPAAETEWPSEKQRARMKIESICERESESSKVTWLCLPYREICIPSWHGPLFCRYRRGNQWGTGGHPAT